MFAFIEQKQQLSVIWYFTISVLTAWRSGSPIFSKQQLGVFLTVAAARSIGLNCASTI
ncbi:hypothetical protein [Chamaesiphon polymorphus]|uniref:hypothetical protein n=1 Tax=Chamaesiphon polymorphus TaxID=2107691 RepID=UPI0015E7255C|nr:hypothetical protein [Chamaesiphon polymorphus]